MGARPRQANAQAAYGNYELRYELTERDVFVLRIFHTHEDR